MAEGVDMIGLLKTLLIAYLLTVDCFLSRHCLIPPNKYKVGYQDSKKLSDDWKDVEEAKDGTLDVVRQESPEPIKEEEKPTGVFATIKTKVVLEKDLNFMKCLFFYNVDFVL
ncbi:hypothetical protein Tco_1180133 [Tanacetum coccineum]